MRRGGGARKHCNFYLFLLPHLLVTVLLERRLPVALLPLGSLLLLLLGLRGQHELLRYLLLRDELRDGTRLPVWFFLCEGKRHRKRNSKRKGLANSKKGGEKKITGGWVGAGVTTTRGFTLAALPLSRANNRCQRRSGTRSRSSVLNAGSRWRHVRRIPSKKRQEVALHLHRIVNTKGENNQSEKDADVMWSSEHWVACGQG